MNTNVWYEYKKMKSDFPVGTEVVLRLEPLDEYFELIWAADAVGTVTGYNIHRTLIIVDFENGSTMHCGSKMLEKTTSLIEGFDF